MAPTEDLWAPKRPEPGGGPPPPENPEPGEPETPEFRRETSSAAASGGHKNNWFLTALGAVGKFFNALLVQQWRWTGLALLAGVAAAALIERGEVSTRLWRVVGVGFAVWFVGFVLTIPGPGPDPVPVTPPPGSDFRPEGDGGQTILAEMATANAARATFWSPIRPVFRTSWERFVRSVKKAWKVVCGVSAAALEWLVAAGKLVAAVVAFLAVGAWEIGKVMFTKPIDRGRPWDKRKIAWVRIGALCAIFGLSVLVGMNLTRLNDARVTILASMSQVALPKLPELRWPTWGSDQIAVKPSAQPAPTVKPKPNPRAWNGGYKTADSTKSAPLPSVAEIESASRKILAESTRLRKETEAAIAKAKAAEAARISAEAKVKAAKRAATPVPVPTVLVAVAPQQKTGSPIKPGMTEDAAALAKVRTELVARTKERDEAQAKAKALAVRPVPTPQIVTRTATVSGPILIVEKVKTQVKTKIVERRVEVKVPVVKTVTKTRTRTVRVPGPTRVVKVNGPARIVTRTATVGVPVPGPERVVYRERTPKQETGSPIRSGMTKNASAKKAVAKAQQPAATTATVRSSDPYGGDPYDY